VPPGGVVEVRAGVGALCLTGSAGRKPSLCNPMAHVCLDDTVDARDRQPACRHSPEKYAALTSPWPRALEESEMHGTGDHGAGS